MLGKCSFSLPLRKSQEQILNLIFNGKKNENKLYVVSPPGSGKTITGLVIAVKFNIPTLVLVPNTAIQGQWIDKTKFFIPPGENLKIASVNPSDNLPITVLTYQALAKTRDISEEEKKNLVAAWTEELVRDGEDESDAGEWIRDLEKNNPEHFQLSLLRRWKQNRIKSDGKETIVNEDSQRLMNFFRERGVRFVVFDECHHLVGYWAQVASALVETLDGPKVLGLTATPPSTKDLSNREIELHKRLLGEVDYRIPTPAVIKDGALAPYQDLVYFTRPTEKELEYVRNCSMILVEVLKLAEDYPSKKLSDWLNKEIKNIPEESFAMTLRKRSVFIGGAVRYLRELNRPVPDKLADFAPGKISLGEKADLAGRFASKYLLVSENNEDRKLFRKLCAAFRPLGFVLTEKGLRNCQSTVGRILALSQSKMDALVDVLSEELKSSDKIRAIVITDFERSSATAAKESSKLLTEESGGAIMAMRTLTSHKSVDILDPILVTGQSVIVDDDLLPKFLQEAGTWFKEKGLDAKFEYEPESGFYHIHGSGTDWNTRNYVAMVTSLFEKNVTRCLVGTRGLLGEGWDSLCANTLIDLTTAATEMTVNQLRGRTIRIDPAWPEKTANIWDIVCFAPEFEKGLSDYTRFVKKHSDYYGICDDGAIECGLGHIHPALAEAGPEDVALHANIFNAEMFERCRRRLKVRENWRIGESYENMEVKTLELKPDKSFDNRAVRGTLKKMRGFELNTSEKIKNICLAVFESLRDGGMLLGKNSKIKISERADNYFRVSLDGGSPVDAELFSKCIDELFQPLDGQRYIIPRWEQIKKDNWLSKMLPEILGKFVMTRENRIAVYHPLPSSFADSKKNAELFSDKWNLHVSPGRAIFAKHGEGGNILAEAKIRGQTVQEARARIKSIWK